MKQHIDEHPIITQWNTMSNIEQSDIITRCIQKAVSKYKFWSVLRLHDFNEVISETWLRLHPKLNTCYIEALHKKLITTGHEGVTLAFIIYQCSCSALGTLKHHDKKSNIWNSLNERIYSNEEEEYINVMPDKHFNVESEVIDKIASEEILNNYSKKNQFILQAAINGYSYEEIASMIGLKKGGVKTALWRLRKKENADRGQKASRSYGIQRGNDRWIHSFA